MKMSNIKPRLVDHIVLMVSDVNRTKDFYSKIFGSPIHEDDDSVAYQIGDTKLFLGHPYSAVDGNRFDKDRVGLNHLAFGVGDLGDLEDCKEVLDKAEINHSDVQIDKHNEENKYIWFDDPDGIRLEFYLRNS